MSRKKVTEEVVEEVEQEPRKERQPAKTRRAPIREKDEENTETPESEE